ncbi:MAG TPA: hypothetical protein VEZ70_04000 [Allosphingosinicella sp.]|nr:hypothetical protein [Allosphingosinicella sp.]
MGKVPTNQFMIADLDEEIVPAGAMVEAKQESIHWITVLVLGIYF